MGTTDPAFLAALEQLRTRLNTLALRHADEVAEVRRELQHLEQRWNAQGTHLENPAVAVPPAMPAPEPEAGVVEEVPVHALVTDEIPPAEEGAAAVPVPSAFPAPAAGEKRSIELQLGRVWLVRLGIALLVTGLVLLGNFAYKNWVRDLPAWVRLAALYVASAGISFTGLWAAGRENLRRFGEPLLAGGLAFAYWCTYAAHHVPRLRVVESPVVAGALLMVAAGGIVAVSLKRGSRVTAVMGLLLASYSTVLQPLGWLSGMSNAMLAAAGVGLMLRRGWSVAGVAAMAGTYVSFAWWQVAGGHGADPSAAAMWYLPPVWALFALPGIAGVGERFGGLSPRGKAWFTSVNHGVFFALFSAMWLMHHRQEDYWMVAGIFGAVLCALGVASRAADGEGGSHFAQGLGAVALATALKLDGQTLALVFALQANGLAWAYRRFGGKSELVFATLTGLLAMGVAWEHSGAPLWSMWLVGALGVAASFPLRLAIARTGMTGLLARTGSAMLFSAAGVLSLKLCAMDMPDAWRAPTAAAIALAGAGWLRWMGPEQRPAEGSWFTLAHGVAAAVLLLMQGVTEPLMTPLLTMALFLGAHGLWVRATAEPRSDDPASIPSIYTWQTALGAGLAASLAVLIRGDSPLDCMAGFSIAAVGLTALARFGLRSSVLPVVAALLLLPAAALQFAGSHGLFQFAPFAAGIGVIAMTAARGPAAWISRAAALVSWMLAWHTLRPEEWGPIMAVSGTVLVFALARRGVRSLPEAWLLLAAGAGKLAASALLAWPWTQAMTAVSPLDLITLAMVSAAAWRQPAGNVRPGLLLGACALTTLWSTRAVVTPFGWEGVTMLWTGLGFALVSLGLWVKTAALRQAGFALLAVALVKLFAADVWDFAAFTRILAFLALGVALVLLGFFYNRFAPVLKRLLESESGGEEKASE